MDVIKVTTPTSWTGSPDPSDYVFLLSLREALNERASCVGIQWECPPILPYLPYNRQVMLEMQDVLYRLIPKFVNHEFKEYTEDLLDYPKMWTVADLVTEEHNIALMPSPGSLSEAWSDWLKAMKHIIGKLTHIPFSNFRGKIIGGSGSVHDPPFNESITTALQNARDNKETTDFQGLPNTLWAWSGNTHYYHDSESDPSNGYCGYADFRAIHITNVIPPRMNAAFTMLFKILAVKPVDPCDYSKELEESVFSGVSGIEEGITDCSYSFSGTTKLNLWFGSESEIPQNASVPHSDFPEDDTAIIRRSTKTGFEAKLFCVLDLTLGLKFK